jgi:hypothetical protein
MSIDSPGDCVDHAKQISKYLLPNTLYHVLTRDSRLKLCRGQPIDERGMTVPEENERKDPNLDIFQMQIPDLWRSGGKSRNKE